MTREVFPTLLDPVQLHTVARRSTALPALPSRLALLLPFTAAGAAFALGARTAAGADSRLVYTHTHTQTHTEPVSRVAEPGQANPTTLSHVGNGIVP